MDAVSSAAQQLGAVDTTTNQTLGSLTAAAAALNTIATSQDGAGSANGQGPNSKPQLPSMWDLKGRIEQHKQKVSAVGKGGRAWLGTRCADADFAFALAAAETHLAGRDLQPVQASPAAWLHCLSACA